MLEQIYFAGFSQRHRLKKLKGRQLKRRFVDFFSCDGIGISTIQFELRLILVFDFFQFKLKRSAKVEAGRKMSFHNSSQVYFFFRLSVRY